LSPVVSTRADVLLSIGEPAYRLEGDRFLLYEWAVAYGYLLFGGPPVTFPFPVVAPHYLCFEFGQNGELLGKAKIVGRIYADADAAIRKCTNPPASLDRDGER
jgi:hypothetical protein